MRFYKIGAVLLCGAVIAFSGCTEMKAVVLSGYADMISELGDLSLTKDADLIGIRTQETDAYTGSYAAACQKARGRDVVFGGCSAQSHRLKITGTIQTQAGQLRITVINGAESERYLTPDRDGNIAADISSHGGDFYFVVDYADFSGTLTLCSEAQ